MTIAKITSAVAAKLNRSNRAAKDANLGTWIQNAPISGSHAVTSAQASASSIIILTNLTTISGQLLQVFRSGSQIASASGIYLENSGSQITITPINGFKTLASDQVDYVVF